MATVLDKIFTEDLAKKRKWPCCMCEYGRRPQKEFGYDFCGKCCRSKPYEKPSEFHLRDNC